MRFRSAVSAFLPLTLCLVTIGAAGARADSVGLSDGNFVGGSTVFSINVAGFIGVDTAVPWSFGSTERPFPSSNLPNAPTWTNSNILGPSFANFTGASGAYMLFTLTNNTLDFNGTGIQSQLTFAFAGTFSQFVSELNSLAVGQSMQLALLTVGQGGCPAKACSQEVDSLVLNDTLGSQQIENIVGPAYLTITNDPGLYEATLTSTPLNSMAAPEPGSLILLGIGVAGLFFVRRGSLERTLFPQ